MALEEAGLQLIAQGIAGYLGDMRKADDATEGFYTTLDKAGPASSGFQQVITGALRETGAMVARFAVDAGKAIAGFVGESVSLAGDFEQGMSVLQATSDATAEEMEQLSAKAKELGSDLTLPATSAVDAGKAMLELAKAGFTVSDQMDAAKGVLQLAAAAQIDEAKAAEINANALQAFGLAAKESVFVSDLLAASANASSLDATDMADTYKMAAAVFSAFQGPVVGSKDALIDLTTAAALLGNAGIKGSDAGTALKQSLLQLTGPSQVAKDQMRALYLATMAEGDAGQNLSLVIQGNAKDRAAGLRGLQESAGATAEMGDIAYDAAGKMRPFPEILRLTAEATKGMTAEQRDAALTSIFGADAVRAILVLMQQGPEAWDKMTVAVTEQGAAQDLAAAQTKGFNGALEGAKSQIETLQLTIGQVLTPVLAELLNTYVSPGIAAITDFADTFFKMGPAIAASDDPLQSFLNALKVAAPNLLDTISALEDIKDGIQGLIASFQQGGAAAQVLGAIFDGQVKNYQTLFGTLGEFIPGILKSIETITGDVLMQITTFWKNNGDEVMATVTQAMKIIGDIYNTVLQIILTLVGDKLTTMAAYFHEHGDQIQQVIKGAWDIISGVVIAGLTLIQGALKIALDIINGDWAAAWGHLQEMSATFVLAITKAITGFLDIIAAAFGTSLTEIGQTWSDIWSMAQEIITKFAADAVAMGADIVSGIIDGIKGSAGKLYNTLSDLASSALDAAKSILDIGSPSKVMSEQVGVPMIQGMISGITSMIPALLATMRDVGDDLTQQAQDIADAVADALQSGFTATANIDRQKLKNLKDIKELSAGSQATVAMQLEDAQKQAMQILDPKESAAFFKQRSAQVFELAELNDQILAATAAGDRALREELIAQYQLINAAQLNETKALAAGQGQGVANDLMTQLGALLGNSAVPVNDTGPGADLAAILRQLTALTMGPQNAQALLAGSGLGGAQYSNTTNLNMPIYTNNSPAALQQSMALAGAVLL